MEGYPSVKGVHVKWSNTEYLEYKFSDKAYDVDVEIVNINIKNDSFRYLGFLIRDDGELDDDLCYMDSVISIRHEYVSKCRTRHFSQFFFFLV